jgi:hypothetical protein
MTGAILLLSLYAFILRTGGALSSPLKRKEQNRLENMTSVEDFQIKAEPINIHVVLLKCRLMFILGKKLF